MSNKLSRIVAGVWVLGLSTFAAETNQPLSHAPQDPVAWAMATYAGEGKVEGVSAAKASMIETDVGAYLPLVERPAYTLAAGLAGSWNRIRFRDLDPALGVEDEDLYVTALPIDLLVTAWKDWSVWANVTPGAFTDYRRLTGDDFRVLFHSMAMYRPSQAVTLALGVSYDREFGDDRVFPIGGVVWNVSREFQINMMLPSPRLTYAPTTGLAFFADARPAGNKWNLGRSEDEEGDFKLETWRIGMGVEARLARHVWLHVAGGVDVARTYTIVENGRTILDADVSDSFFARSGLLVR